MKRNRLLLCYSSKFRITQMMLSCAMMAMIALISSNAWAQKMPVKGKVTDQTTGETLIGVTVKASDGAAVATGVDGSYTIQVSPQGSLTVSYTGYTATTVQVNGQATVNIKLTAANTKLNEVVVVGYGTQKRKDVTGAIASIKVEGGPKESVPYVNPLEAIQGTPGINVGPSASAGATPNIVVRGQNSINANQSPLIVLDGVIFNGDLNEINMNDVATYDVLKDASSAAIYGSRSQNGVVLITTKRGKSDKPQINFNTYYGIQSWTRVPDMRKGEDYIQWRKDLAISKGQDASTIPILLAASPLELKAYNEGHTMDWIDEVSQYAPLQNYDLSVSGRTDKVNYYFSAGFINQKGVLYGDNYKKPNLTLKVENTINSWLSYGINGYYSSRDLSGNPADLYMATYLSPYSYKYMDGTTNLQRYPQGNGSNYNPYWGNPSLGVLGTIDDNVEKYTSARATGYINVKVPFIPGLSYRLNVNAQRSTYNIANFHHETAEVNTLLASDVANPSQFLAKAYGNKTYQLGNTYLFDNLLNYTHEFGSHHIDALLGYTRDNSVQETLGVRGSDFSNFGTTTLGIYGLQNAGTQTLPATANTYLESSNIGYIGRLNYNYKGKYYATVNFRRDGYSAFAPGHKFGNFPGASVAWALSEEDFMKKVSLVNNLKLRASYGHTGNQGVAPYQTQATVSTSYLAPGYTVFGATPAQYTFPSQLGNQNLTWEKTAALNFGLDFTILNNRLSGTIDVYTSKTTDLLYTLPLSPVTGYPSALTNIGQLNNKGIEISLSSVNIKTDDGFKWETGYAFWMNRNKLVKITGIINPATGKENDNTGASLFIGKSLGAIYDYTFDGIVQTSDVAYMTANPTYKPGDVKFKDIDGDGKITSADRSIIGYAKENFNMNMSNTFTYKNFQLYFSFNGIFGGGKNHYFESTNLRGLDPGAITSGNWLNQQYWTASNPSNEYPRPNYANPNSYGFYQSRTFVRLQNASFSYSFPKALTEKLKIANLKLYVSGTNLFTFTGWTGLDPANGGQIGGNGGSSTASVLTSSPIIRTVSFGLNAGF